MGSNTLKYFFISCGITMIVGHYFLPLFAGATDDQPMTEANEQNQDAKREDTDFEGIQIEKIIEKEPTYNIDIHMPIFGDDKLNRVIKKHIKYVKEEFFAAIKGNVNEERSGDLTIRTDIFLSGMDLYSVIMTDEMFTGGANVNQQAKVWLVDINQDQFVKQESLFKDVEEARNVIRPMVRDTLLQSSQYSGAILEDALNEWVEHDEYYFGNMFIREQNLVFKFNKYDVTAGAAGMPEVEIPISQVKDLLKPKWFDRIKQ